MGTKSPLLRQYEMIKTSHPDCIVLMRSGDFWETYNEDAKTVAETIGTVLTKRTDGETIPLTGFTQSSLDIYLPKLVRAGHRVALAENITRVPDQFEEINLDVGDEVYCDSCNEDYTTSEKKGGVLFNRKAFCPKCAPRIIELAKKHQETRFLTYPNPDESFYKFVLRIR